MPETIAVLGASVALASASRESFMGGFYATSHPYRCQIQPVFLNFKGEDSPGDGDTEGQVIGTIAIEPLPTDPMEAVVSQAFVPTSGNW